MSSGVHNNLAGYTKRKRFKAKTKTKKINFQSKPGVCCFCGQSKDDESVYGRFLHRPDLSIHYFCMLFASGLSQNGRSEKEGVLGFLYKDIDNECKRSKRLKCAYCKKVGATIGCVVRNCRSQYHYGCGYGQKVLCQYFGNFCTYCPEHRPRQSFQQTERLAFKGTAKTTCPICMCAVDSRASYATLRAPCCKNVWYHRQCIQSHATASGLHFFKCPMCNNQDLFQEEMLKFGIYIPDQDAAWEMEPNAYQDLLERHSRCDVAECMCPNGREFFALDTPWEIVLCDWCGSTGTHPGCSNFKSNMDDWICQGCNAVDTKTDEKKPAVKKPQMKNKNKNQLYKELLAEKYNKNKKQTKTVQKSSLKPSKKKQKATETQTPSNTELPKSPEPVDEKPKKVQKKSAFTLNPLNLSSALDELQQKSKPRSSRRSLLASKPLDMEGIPSASKYMSKSELKSLLTDDIHTGRGLGHKLQSQFYCDSDTNSVNSAFSVSDNDAMSSSSRVSVAVTTDNESLSVNKDETLSVPNNSKSPLKTNKSKSSLSPNNSKLPLEQKTSKSPLKLKDSKSPLVSNSSKSPLKSPQLSTSMEDSEFPAKTGNKQTTLDDYWERRKSIAGGEKFKKDKMRLSTKFKRHSLLSVSSTASSGSPSSPGGTRKTLRSQKAAEAMQEVLRADKGALPPNLKRLLKEDYIVGKNLGPKFERLCPSAGGASIESPEKMVDLSNSFVLSPRKFSCSLESPEQIPEVTSRVIPDIKISSPGKISSETTNKLHGINTPIKSLVKPDEAQIEKLKCDSKSDLDSSTDTILYKVEATGGENSCPKSISTPAKEPKEILPKTNVTRKREHPLSDGVSGHKLSPLCTSNTENVRSPDMKRAKTSSKGDVIQNAKDQSKRVPPKAAMSQPPRNISPELTIDFVEDLGQPVLQTINQGETGKRSKRLLNQKSQSLSQTQANTSSAKKLSYEDFITQNETKLLGLSSVDRLEEYTKYSDNFQRDERTSMPVENLGTLAWYKQNRAELFNAHCGCGTATSCVCDTTQCAPQKVGQVTRFNWRGNEFYGHVVSDSEDTAPRRKCSSNNNNAEFISLEEYAETIKGIPHSQTHVLRKILSQPASSDTYVDNYTQNIMKCLKTGTPSSTAPCRKDLVDLTLSPKEPAPASFTHVPGVVISADEVSDGDW